MTQTEPEPIYKTACGGTLRDPSNYLSALYHDDQVYFCTRACRRVFEKDPDSFMAGKVEHPFEED
jgi:YHS domain-containing protein